MIEMDCREMLGVAAAAMPGGGQRRAHGFEARPLPFDPEIAPGLSKRLLTSHHKNNYSDAVRRLDQITHAFAALDPATKLGFQISGLNREELLAWNSTILHELCLAGFGRPDAPATSLAQVIERGDFGSHDRWRAELAALGKALGRGSGWVLLTSSPRDRWRVNQWAANHSMDLAGSTPLLTLDMSEHAYCIDYGANAGAYVEASMQAIDWRAASDLYQRMAA